jgi:proliferating cell nuclear antigen
MQYLKDSGNVLTIKTVQITAFKTLMTALKEILVETNISFDPTGIKIINMDRTHTILAHLFLQAEKFEIFECKKEKIIIGVNMPNLFKLINTIEHDDTLTIYIENNDYIDGIVSFLTLKFENADKKQYKIQRLRLIEPEMDEIEYPDIKFPSIINFPSCDFQKIIKDMSSISEKIEIKSVGNELIFKCMGQFATAEVVRSESDENMVFISKQQNQSKIIQGEFPLKSLGYFIKCTNLCLHVEIYLENDLPLVIKYDVADLGSIYLCLSQLASN